MTFVAAAPGRGIEVVWLVFDPVDESICRIPDARAALVGLSSVWPTRFL